MKKAGAIILFLIFLANCIMVPFCNFQDTVSAKILYAQFLQKDDDGDVLEFITEDMLNLGVLFEEEDEPKAPVEQSPRQQPFQAIQISPGFLYCAQPLLLEEKEEPVTPRVFGSFIDHKYEIDFFSSIFHPPSLIA